MAFKPKQSSKSSSDKTDRPYDPADYPVPRKGPRKARISLIVDMGIQTREPIYIDPEDNNKIVTEETPGAVLKEQNPCQQIAIFADLPHDVVKYGGDIGEKQYRLLLNKSYNGKIRGIPFVQVPVRHPKTGEIIKNDKGRWKMSFPGASLLNKLVQAVGRPDIGETGDIEELLNLPFMANVAIKEATDKNGKLDVNGEVIVYKNVQFKGPTELPVDDDTDEPVEVNELLEKPRCITFDSATEEDVQFIRYALRKQIKEAADYPGSQMQKAIEAFEAKQAAKGEVEQEEADDASDGDEEEKPAPKKEPKKPAAKKAAPKKEEAEDDDDSDAPF